MASISPERQALLDDHLKAESEHDLDHLMEGFTADCFNDVACFPDRFDGPTRVAERYTAHWKAFPDFTVRIRRIPSADEDCIVTENEWTGTYEGTFQGIPPTGRKVKVRAIVAWHFQGERLQGETVFFDTGSIARQLGAEFRLTNVDG